MSAAASSRRPCSAQTSATVVAEISAQTVWLRGPGSVIHAALRAARAPKQYDRARRAIAVPRGHADDVLAALELQIGVDVERRPEPA
jgi:hypothetical protein